MPKFRDPKECADASAAWEAFRAFKRHAMIQTGRRWHELTGGHEAARLVQRAFFAGWHERKTAELKTGYRGTVRPPPIDDPKVAEAVLLACLGWGAKSVNTLRLAADNANVAWAAMLRAANVHDVRICTIGSSTNWRLPTIEDELADTGLFMDAGIPIG